MEAIFYTNRGLHPHLVNPLQAVQLCLSHIYPVRSVLAQTSLQDYFCLPSSLISLSLRDILDPHSFIYTSDTSISIRSPETSTLDVNEYMSFVNSLGFDLVPSFAEEADCKSGNHKSGRSAKRAVEALDQCLALKQGSYKLLGNIQGGKSIKDRVDCALHMSSREVDGFVLGGFGMNDRAWDIVEEVGSALEGDNRVKMLSGLGRPLDIIHGAAFGFNIFEVVYPFVAAKDGKALLSRYNQRSEFDLKACATEEVMNLNDAQYKRDSKPLVDGCPCLACKSHTRAYIHHLLTCEEMTGNLLLTLHNVEVTQGLITSLKGIVEANQSETLKELLASEAVEQSALLIG